MSNRNWLPGPALGVGLIIATLLIFAATLNQYKENAERAQYAAYQQHNGTEKDALATTGAHGEAESPPPNPTPSREEWRSEQDLGAQQEMARWAVWMFLASLASVVITAIGVIYVARTLDHTRLATEAAITAANAAQASASIDAAVNRPWIMAHARVVKVLHVSADKIAARIRFTAENIGARPAIQVSFNGAIAHATDDDPPIHLQALVAMQQWMKEPVHQPFGLTIFPSRHFSEVEYLELTKVPVDEATGALRLAIIGVAQYREVPKGPLHQTPFAFEIFRKRKKGLPEIGYLPLLREGDIKARDIDLHPDIDCPPPD
jgi:hypothetical protein